MRVGIYSPYLETAGGGEKYMLTIAEVLSKNHQVDFLLGTHLYSSNIDQIRKRIETLHGLDLSRINFTKAPFWPGSSLIKRLFFLMKYNWLFYLTDGSIFLSTAKNSVIHFQAPHKNTAEKGWWGRIKLLTWKQAIYNSCFTKNIVEQNWPIQGKVVYPPVATQHLKPGQKKKQILSVGRFSGHLQDKKHSLLIKIFKELVKDNHLSGWSLHLVGGMGKGDQDYLASLKKEARGAAIYLHPDLPYQQLVKLYGESIIYWHAKGFGEEDPTKMEHFGITTVEAMAAGCVPVVIKSGGQLEIVDARSGLLWNSQDELIDFTLKLINDSQLREKLAKGAITRAKMFSKERFASSILNLVHGD